MALALDPALTYALSLEQWHAMVAAGVLDDEPVELLAGRPVRVTPQGPGHAGVLARLQRHLLPLDLAGEARLAVQLPLTLAAAASEPEPDLALVDPVIDVAAHPTTARLVVEVAVSSAQVDRELKAPLYAAAGIPEYWLVDVPAGRVEVRRAPGPDGYRELELVGRGGELRVPGFAAHPPLAVAALLAGL